jgi:hypothetical protein
MFLSYLNYQLNAYPGIAPRKPPVVIDLKNLYRHLTSKQLPYVSENITFESIELCSNSKGCNPKKEGGKMNYLVAMKDSKNNIKTTLYDDETKSVLLNIRGKYKIGSKMCELYLRIPKSAAIGVRIGMSEQNIIKIDENGDSKIESLRMKITKQLFDILGIVPNLRPSKLNGMAVHGLNLHNPKTGKRPDQKIKNFLSFLRLLDSHLEAHSLDYDKKDGKQVARGNFKPDIHGTGPTIGITSWTMVDFVGGKSIAQVINLSKTILNIFNKIKNTINYTTNAKQPKAHGKADLEPKGCPANVPPANSNGTCPSDNYIPLPNKHKSICCYKKKLTKTTALNALKKYKNSNMKIPQSLQNRFNTLGIAVPQKPNKPSSVKLTSIYGVTYNKISKNFFYKGKKFNCITMPKPDLESISLLMKLNPKGFKKDLCSKIHKKAQYNANEKYKSARRKLLKMKAKLANMKYSN